MYLLQHWMHACDVLMQQKGVIWFSKWSCRISDSTKIFNHRGYPKPKRQGSTWKFGVSFILHDPSKLHVDIYSCINTIYTCMWFLGFWARAVMGRLWWLRVCTTSFELRLITFTWQPQLTNNHLHEHYHQLGAIQGFNSPLVIRK